jgi:cell division protein FtsB
MKPALLLLFALAAGAAGFFARQSHAQAARISALEAQVRDLTAHSAELEAAVRQAESESGHPILTNQ